MDRLASLDLHTRLDEPALADMVATLQGFSPHVEAKADEGLFWLDGNGIEAIFGSHRQWGRRIFDTVKEEKSKAEPTVVVGFTRTITAAIARCSRGFIYLETPEAEAARVARIPIRHLGLPPKIFTDLTKLGIRTVANLLTLPSGGLRERFGSEISNLLARLAKKKWDPITPLPELVPITTTVYFDHPESSATRLTFTAKTLLRTLLRQIRRQHQMLATLEMVLELDRYAPHTSHLEPAEPTLDEVQLTDLIRLRFEGTDLGAGVTGITLTAEGAPATKEQLELFQKKSRRDLHAADRALARLRAEFGQDAVTRAALKPGHLPEARFTLTPQPKVRLPAPSLPKQPFTDRRFKGQLIRRVFVRPIPLQNRPVVGPRGCHLLGMTEAPSTRIHGPFVISGGWWANLVHREYYFTETESGEILWVYFDKRRRKWFLHGKVE